MGDRCAAPNVRRVGFRHTEYCSKRGNRHRRKLGLNLAPIGFFVKPLWLVGWFPSPNGRRVPSSAFTTLRFRLHSMRDQSSLLRCFDKFFCTDSNLAGCAAVILCQIQLGPARLAKNYSISAAGSGRSPFQDNARHHLHNRQNRSHALQRAGTLQGKCGLSL